MHAQVCICIVARASMVLCSLNCLFEWTYSMSYAMTMCLPFFVIAIQWLRHKLCGLEKDTCVQIVATFLVIVYACTKILGKPVVAPIESSLNPRYNGLATKCLQIFLCLKLPDGTWMLNANPDITYSPQSGSSL